MVPALSIKLGLPSDVSWSDVLFGLNVEFLAYGRSNFFCRIWISGVGRRCLRYVVDSDCSSLCLYVRPHCMESESQPPIHCSGRHPQPFGDLSPRAASQECQVNCITDVRGEARKCLQNVRPADVPEHVVGSIACVRKLGRPSGPRDSSPPGLSS